MEFKPLKNERGYALLVVVLITVLVMGFFTFFVTASLNNANQEQTVDQNHLAYAAAEMGVESYTSYYINKYLAITNEGPTCEVESTEDIEECLRGVITKVISHDEPLDVKMNLIEEPELPADYSFRLTEGPIYTGDWEIGGEVQGFNQKNSELNKEIRFYITFSMPDANFVDSENMGAPSIKKPREPEIEKPDQECSLSRGFSLQSDSCFVGNNYNFDKMELTNSTLWINNNTRVQNSPYNIINSDFYIGGNMNNAPNPLMKGSKIYANGNFDVSNNLTVDGESLLYVVGNISGANQPKIYNNSEVFTGGNFNISNDLIVDSESLLYVSGNITGANQPKIYNNSEIYVGGNFNGNNNLEVWHNSLLYVKGNLNQVINPSIEDQSMVYVNGNFNTNNDTKINNSSLYVGGNFNGGKIFVENNSRLCVGGNINYQNDFSVDPQSYVYIKKGENQSLKNLTKNVIEVNTNEELKEECNINSQVNELNWDMPTVEVEYE